MKVRILLMAAMTTLLCPQLQAQQLPYKNSTLPIEKRVSDLLGRMTVEEKVGQLSKLLGWEMYSKNGKQVTISNKLRKAVKEQHIGLLWATLRADPWTQKTLLNGLSPVEAARATNAIQRYMVDSTRLGIPLLLSEEAPHGHMAIGATVFPTAIGQASTWNPMLIQDMASTIAMETYAVGGKNGYGPVLDLARDPRWSRTEETYGEDPYLIGQMGTAMIRGFQGEKLGERDKIIGTLKHFVAYAAPDGGHNGESVSFGERSLRQYFLPPFERAVKSGAGSVMTAYNSIDGIPCSANPWLLKDILRKDWGFTGFVVSDLLSISGLNGGHATAATAEEAASQSIHAGLDVDLSGTGYGSNLLKAVQQGLVEPAVLDTAVARVLRMKFNLGLFDHPYADEKLVAQKVATAQNKTVARQVARESIVLLKNDQHILPLSKSLKRIAVIGPNADNAYNQLGDYTAPQAEGKVQTLLTGIRAAVGNSTKVDYVKGCAIRDTSNSDIAAAVAAAKQADAVVLVLGGSSARDFKTSYQATGAANVDPNTVSDMESGEGFDRVSLDMMGDQIKLLKAIQATGKPVVLVTIMGRPLNLNWAAEHVPAIVNAWYPGQEGGLAIADVLFGDYNPAGRLPISVPRSVGQLPVHYNHTKPKHHDYVEMSAKPLYAFGYGLSYSSFDYSNLQVSLKENGNDFVCMVSFDVANNGKLAGDEVAQLYVVDEVSSVVTPVMQLKRFERKNIAAGKKERYSFQLTKEDLKLWNAGNEWKTEKGRFKLLVGASSDDIRLKGETVLTKDY
ncbi:glycoside hydrolase family 3 C-terminal domain-containing protein [Sphingobacterium paramultivorum]|uniref:Glycoside hydrolase family 3 C-terminal domain-containing protein n=1 Tax=Sphingobacterium paramultivorum TaxID=2886510 RepID=A0A7G5E5L5_9SPHI|nr:glycoside hydrolase family 3 N-terminal domain-containing protein [Sphingobacterium paramultivorum]QMV69290.1 glycoside hydrolase family 3 C-terminal domain-containing protein [Sphingobacterium paramultivorum]WSO13086.1 glycoside hydrolase family 3 N-terminal domain-containing protein [Sphingobacterium paramultivorum]